MKKIWHHYLKWEEYQAGMWNTITGEKRQELLNQAIEFTGNVDLYGSWMLRVITEWPISCEQHLSDVHMNRQAWIGHAACCLATGIPEDITRAAWANLSPETQTLANEKAQTAIQIWELNHAKQNSKIYQQVEKARI